MIVPLGRHEFVLHFFRSSTLQRPRISLISPNLGLPLELAVCVAVGDLDVSQERV
jgi:hypothetical protein